MQLVVILHVHAHACMCGNRSNKARIHVHFSLCQELDIFMDFTLIINYFGFVDLLLSLKRQFLLKFVGLPFLYVDQRFSVV